jgi:AraC-like DNA-binding protein/ligand-binding sensor protein
MKKEKAAISGTLRQEFKKDLELFAYFLVLLNSSSPIRNVELMWAEDLDLFDPGQRPRVTTGEALVQLKPLGDETPGRTSPSPSTHFCDLVHGFGSHEEQTCGRSDKAAKERCRATGCSQVYPCHVGLTDIAVPVVCEGRYLGTLFSGQVLVTTPTAESFGHVREALAEQTHIDMTRLEEAYYRVPVVTLAQIAEMRHMMEVFARYLANSWKRLEIMSEFQRVRERELALDRRELAEMLLARQGSDGASESQEALRTLAADVGLGRLPERVLVLRMAPSAFKAKDEEDAEQRTTTAISGHLALVRVGHLIEDMCRSWTNTLATSVAPGEICILTAQKSRTPGHERMVLEEMAQALVRAVRAQGLTQVRVGVSALHGQPAELLRGYHEACAALDATQGVGAHSTQAGAIQWFESLPERRQQPAQVLSTVLKALQSGAPGEVATGVREFLSVVAPAGASSQQLHHARGLLTWACEHLARELATMGIESPAMSAAKEEAEQQIVAATTSFAMADSFRRLVEKMRLQVAETFSQREQKIVIETQRLVREIGPARVTIQQLASNLELSPGHLGRVFSRTTGTTLEEYLIRQRLELGKRLLLDPRLHVAEVADRCGFCNPAYFASVFKKHMHCTPRAYARQPQRFGMPETRPSELNMMVS